MLKKRSRSRRRQWRTRRINGHIKQRIWGNISLKNRPFLRGNRRRRSSHSLLHPNDVRQGVEMHWLEARTTQRSIASDVREYFQKFSRISLRRQRRRRDATKNARRMEWVCIASHIFSGFVIANLFCSYLLFLFVFYLKFLVSLFSFFSVRNAKNLVKSSAWDNNKQNSSRANMSLRIPTACDHCSKKICTIDRFYAITSVQSQEPGIQIELGERPSITEG